jgi:taurine transport system permease protein
MGVKKTKSYPYISILSALVIFLAWYLITRWGNMPKLIFPAPGAVWTSFLKTVTRGYKGHTLWEHLLHSLRRLGIAYGIAMVTAIPAGLLSGRFPKLAAALDPIIAFYRPLPPLAYYTVLVLWMGIDDDSKIMLLFLAGFAPIYISCVAGVTRIRADYINGAKNLGATAVQIFFYVIFPVSLPDIFTGLRNAMAAMYSTLVAAEMVAAISGVGWMVLDASKYLQSDIIFVGIITMGITGIILDEVLKRLEQKIVFWKGHN